VISISHDYSSKIGQHQNCYSKRQQQQPIGEPKNTVCGFQFCTRVLSPFSQKCVNYYDTRIYMS